MRRLWALTGLIALGCLIGGCAGPRGETMRLTVAPDAHYRPEPFTLYAGADDLRHISIVVDACFAVGHVGVVNRGSDEVVTVYAARARHCAAGHGTVHRDVTLAQPYGCTRSIVDGATGKGPRFAPGADEQNFTFSCPGVAASPSR